MIPTILVAAFVPMVTDAASSGWVYANPGDTEANAAAQEASWGGLCSDGREQSPINVVTGEAVPAGYANIRTQFSGVLDYVKNSGHGFQLFETSPRTHKFNATSGASEVDALGSAKGYSMINGERFNFYQVHWHSPSENTVDGVSYPLEAHFVHQLDDVSLHGTYHRLAVIGLLYELGECNEFLDNFWAQFPQMSGIQQYSGPALDFNTKLIQQLEGGYYHWYGSLTTPPCTEGVSWNLLKVRDTVCQRQVDAITTALGNSQHGIRFNNRVTMPLNHRIVSETNAAPVAQVDRPLPSSDSSDVTNAHLMVVATANLAVLLVLLMLAIAIYYRMVKRENSPGGVSLKNRGVKELPMMLGAATQDKQEQPFKTKSSPAFKAIPDV